MVPGTKDEVLSKCQSTVFSQVFAGSWMLNCFTSPALMRVGAGTVKPYAVRVANLQTYPSVDARLVATASVFTGMLSWDVFPSTLTYKT